MNAHDTQINNPVELEHQLNQMAGTVTNGLFTQHYADVLLGGENGIITILSIITESLAFRHKE